MNLGKLVAKLALGISLASAPVVYGCGDEGDNEPEYCYTDADCHGDRYCGEDGKCHFLDNNGSNSGSYNCQDLCEHLYNCCYYGTESTAEVCIYDVDHGNGFSTCGDRCKSKNLPQEYINCYVESSSCDKHEIELECGE